MSDFDMLSDPVLELNTLLFNGFGEVTVMPSLNVSNSPFTPEPTLLEEETGSVSSGPQSPNSASDGASVDSRSRSSSPEQGPKPISVDPPTLILGGPSLVSQQAVETKKKVSSRKGKGTKRSRDTAMEAGSSSDDISVKEEADMFFDEKAGDEEEEDDGTPATKKSKTRSGAARRVKKERDMSDDEDPALRSKRDRNKAAAAKYRNKKKKLMQGMSNKADQLQKIVREQNEQMQTVVAENMMLKSQLDYMKDLLSRVKEIALPQAAPAAVTMFVLFACICLISPGLPLTLNHSASPNSASSGVSSASFSRQLLWNTPAAISPANILLGFEALGKSLLRRAVFEPIAMLPASDSASEKVSKLPSRYPLLSDEALTRLFNPSAAVHVTSSASPVLSQAPVRATTGPQQQQQNDTTANPVSEATLLAAAA